METFSHNQFRKTDGESMDADKRQTNKQTQCQELFQCFLSHFGQKDENNYHFVLILADSTGLVKTVLVCVSAGLPLGPTHHLRLKYLNNYLTYCHKMSYKSWFHAYGELETKYLLNNNVSISLSCSLCLVNITTVWHQRVSIVCVY